MKKIPESSSTTVAMGTIDDTVGNAKRGKIKPDGSVIYKVRRGDIAKAKVTGLAENTCTSRKMERVFHKTALCGTHSTNQPKGRFRELYSHLR